jgi:hypothetical protein
MQVTAMRTFSLFLLVAGWFVVVASIALLRPGFVPAFAAAGFAVELLALVLLARAQAAVRRLPTPRQERRY